MPRRITIFLAAPPGDNIRPAREYFHEYIKPILVAGAIDWEVIEGRREGEVRAGLAEKIRKLRKRQGETPPEGLPPENPEDETKEQLLYEMRKGTGATEWNGVQGDLILGRHTWKEYVRGMHEGWLGPLLEPQSSRDLATESQTTDGAPEAPRPESPPPDADLDSSTPQTEPAAPDPPPEKPKKISPVPPYVSPAGYLTCPAPPSLPPSLEPSLPLPLPHLLGFLNTPTRLYRFLTRRHLAESTGRSVAALVLATQARQYSQSAEHASAVDPDDASPSAASDARNDSVALSKETWEQEAVLEQEETEWHKSARKPNEEGDTRERVWQEPMVIDSRIGQRMRQFELASDEDQNAVQIDEQKRLQADGLVERARKWTGWTQRPKHGSEMGLEGSEDE